MPVDIASVAALFADPSRARMLAALLDGRALPASVLAAESDVSPSTASEHLGRLRDGGVVRSETSGRHRYYSLAGPDVAAALEALSRIAPPAPVRSLRASGRLAAMRRARACYDHLAGQLGVDVTAGLVSAGALVRTDGGDGVQRRTSDGLAAPVAEPPFGLGLDADGVLARLGVDLPALRNRPASARPLLRACVDWTEQRYHLAGALGAIIFTHAITSGWVQRRPGGRALLVTDTGRAALAKALGDAQLAPAV